MQSAIAWGRRPLKIFVVPTCLPLSNWSLYLWSSCLCWELMQLLSWFLCDLIWFVFFERFLSLLKLWAVTVLSSHQGCCSMLCYVAQSLTPLVFPAVLCALAVCCNENFCLASSSVYGLLNLDENFQKTLEWPLLRRSRLCQKKLPFQLMYFSLKYAVKYNASHTLEELAQWIVTKKPF